MKNEEYIINTLKEYDNSYYNGEPEVSDEYYDLFRKKAMAMFPNNEYFNEVGSSIPGEKVQLKYVLGSLNKIHIDTIDKWMNEHKGPWVISEKMDGISIEVVYRKGKVVYAVTRGDGYYGKDITDKAKIFCPKIEYTDEIDLRAEAMLIGDSYTKLGFKNRRNGAGGILNQDDIERCEFIKPFFYELIEGPNKSTEIKRIEFLKSLGLQIPKILYKENPFSYSTVLVKFLNECKSNDSYDIDGLVITPNSYKREDVLLPKNKIAFKVNSLPVEATVNNVKWTTSRTGRVIPVVNIIPKEIGGVTVSKATGFNAKFIQDEQIQKGSTIGIVRSGDVIPYIIENYSKDNDKNFLQILPEICPSCGEPIILKGVDLICENENCSSKSYKIVEHFLLEMGVENITEKTLIKLGLDTIKKCYEVDEYFISRHDGFGIKKASIIVDEISSTLCRTIKPENLLSAFGIPNVGLTIAKEIFNNISDSKFDKIFEMSISDFESMDGIGPIIALNLFEYLPKYKDLYLWLVEKGLEFNMSNIGTLKGKKITLTGTGSIKRNDLQKMIEREGGSVVNMKKSVDFLVTDDLDSNSGKSKKAREYNIPIMLYEDFMKFFHNNS